MSTLRHIRISVRGALRRTDAQLKREWKGDIITDTGEVVKVVKTGAEIREFFLDQLSQGREYLPLGECDGFDYKTGCPGHPVDEKVEP